jgi:hypothetical protein
MSVVRGEDFTSEAWTVLVEAQSALGQFGARRKEYVLLAVHALHVGHAPEDVGSS